jgi:hypothetical protein
VCRFLFLYYFFFNSIVGTVTHVAGTYSYPISGPNMHVVNGGTSLATSIDIDTISVAAPSSDILYIADYSYGIIYSVNMTNGYVSHIAGQVLFTINI